MIAVGGRSLFAGLLVAVVVVAQTPANRRQFVTCPIVRDTKTVPCWLAEYKGELYFLGMQGGVAQEFYPPQLMHEVLVEGTVSDAPRVCGGLRLSQTKISVLPELAPACNTMLPAEEGIEGIVVPRLAGIPATWVRIGGPDQVTIYFDFDNDFLSLHMTGALRTLAEGVLKTPAKAVRVAGSRAASRLSGGGVLTERQGIAELRALKVVEILVGLGVPKDVIHVEAPAAAVIPDGINDPWNRNVVVLVQR